ncbi:ABC transporter substrate-binding protein [Streptomyces sp. NBC_00009]|uniref:ABC transporter substrate-binding protein n=1 Tax=Streptomyces sp. NBC_00009 TaxID=2975620 RepID=UPI0032469A6A
MVDEETRPLCELYEAARAEGGRLTVYAGGDIPTQQDGVLDAFAAAFADVHLDMIVDYSKYHDVRIDRQIATGSLVADVTQLQTSFDFTRWKRQGLLTDYKPAGFDQVHDLFKDPDGSWVAVAVYAFSYLTGVEGGPASPEELADPRWKGKIASSHPGDDDATLFLFKKYADVYGWDWLTALADQGLAFHRGTNSPGEAVAAKTHPVGLAGAAAGLPGVDWRLPTAPHPFLAWGQRAAMLRGAPHPAAARLYLNWMLSADVQRTGFLGWGVRTDVLPDSGPAVWDLPEAHVAEFYAFMEDRALVEWWRQSMVLLFGEVRGEPTPGWLGPRPTRHA